MVVTFTLLCFVWLVIAAVNIENPGHGPASGEYGVLGMGGAGVAENQKTPVPTGCRYRCSLIQRVGGDTLVMGHL
jgi:hypothetical protein